MNTQENFSTFTLDLRQRIEARGYLTSRIEQFMDTLQEKGEVYSEEVQRLVRSQVVILSKDRETALQSLYVVCNLLKGLPLLQDMVEVTDNTYMLLKEIYNSNLLQDEEHIDLRNVAWSILETNASSMPHGLKSDVLSLCAKVKTLPEEDGLVRAIVNNTVLRLHG